MFNSLTTPNYPSNAIGIEDGWLSVVSIRSGRSGFDVKQAATLDMPSAILMPSFLDQNIMDRDGFVALLREVVELAGLLGQRRWSATLPSSAARSAILTLDGESSSRSETEEILDWKAEQAFGAPAIEMRVSRQKISPDTTGRTRYFATAVRLPVIDEYESVFEDLGWKTGLILPRAVGEAHWLNVGDYRGDSLLISSNSEGFTALLTRGGEPAVVRSVTCSAAEADDEIYRLLMFYNDRFAGEGSTLGRLLVVGQDIVPERVRQIASEALGADPSVLNGEDVILRLGESGLRFDELAAPAGLAMAGA
jgi:hypothetical protein